MLYHNSFFDLNNNQYRIKQAHIIKSINKNNFEPFYKIFHFYYIKYSLTINFQSTRFYFIL
jgi:hypothetical protein